MMFSIHKNRWVPEEDIRVNKLINEHVIQKNEKKAKKKKDVVVKKEKKDFVDTPDTETDYTHYKQIIDSLNDDRSRSYNEWTRVCICLVNISKKKRINLLDLWHHFSKKAGNLYDHESVQKEWDKYFNHYEYELVSENSLYYMLKTDNPEVFDEIICIDKLKCINQKNRASFIAEIMKKLFEGQFVYRYKT